jgi:hypothetical protein
VSQFCKYSAATGTTRRLYRHGIAIIDRLWRIGRTLAGGIAVRAAAILVLGFALLPAASAAGDARLSFAAQTGFVAARFPGDPGQTVALAGRRDDGQPMLALLRLRDGELVQREIRLPANAVAIDSAVIADAADALFVLCTDRVLRLSSFDAKLITVAETSSLYRGRSFAELSAAVDFAKDVTGDGRPELLIQDFDVLHVHAGENYERRSELRLPSIRRSYERAVTYRPPRFAPLLGRDGTRLISIRGNAVLGFAGDAAGFDGTPKISPLALDLSEEHEIEAFYNGYDSIDQSQFELREPELLRDINGDGLPDLITLQTVSSGVFDKTSVYRVHLATQASGEIAYLQEPDTTLSSRDYQFGIRAESLGENRLAIVSPGVKIGLRAVIGALFSRSVTLQIAIYTIGDDGVFAETAATVVKTKIRFDFGSGQVESPTIEFGDFDADGRNDLLLKVGRDRLAWRRNEGGGRFEREDRILDIAAPVDGTAVHAVDMDGDRRSEVIVRYGRGDGDALNGIVRVLGSGP